MRVKKTTWLIALVFGVWGTIAYKIFQGIETEDVNQTKQPQMSSIPTAYFKENYPLALNYNDPFLKNSIKTKKVANPPVIFKKAQRQPSTPPTSTVQWERIEYLGSIFNASRKVTLASIRIDGVDYMVKEGDIASSFKIESIARDSIELTFGTQSKYIDKKK